MYTVCKFQFNCFSRLAAAVRKYEQAASLSPPPPPPPPPSPIKDQRCAKITLNKHFIQCNFRLRQEEPHLRLSMIS